MNFLWIFEADAVWTLVPISAALFALGGSGFKEFRRIGIPAVMAAAALSLDLPWWRVLLSTVLLGVVLTKGYGAALRSDLGRWYYPALYVVGELYGACAILISSHWSAYIVCPVVPALVFGFLTFCSQRFDFPRWKWVEILTGAAVGFSFAYALGGAA